jgi:DOMON domain/PEP-CTERM motif
MGKMMNLHRVIAMIAAALLAGGWLAPRASAIAVAGAVDVLSPEGQFLSLKMTIDDATTRFEMTGPSYSWFAFGFDTTTMMGYAVIVTGIDDLRSVAEQNLVAIGNPGTPQLTQNLDFLDLTQDDGNSLTTLLLERPNDTGDPNDPVFSPNMTSLDLIFAYDSAATLAAPNGSLSNHGHDGRGVATITFEPVPEPASWCVFATSLGLMGIGRRRIGRRHRVAGTRSR